MPLQTSGIVIKNVKIKSQYFLLEIYCPPIATQIKPGQFIMLKVSDNPSPLLRRPFSVYKSFSAHDAEITKRGRLLILYKKVGKGTQKMTEFKRGQEVELIGPLGNTFILPPASRSGNIFLIGGGVGIVSLYPLAEKLKTRKLSVFIGGRTRNDILCTGDFKNLNSTLFIATEDGSTGFKGTVIDLFLSQEKKWDIPEPSHLYTCGPTPMLQELGKVLKSKGIPCQASLEARMACGFGACWGCVVKTNDPNLPYQRVCKEGPVFHLEEIVWESR